MYLSLSLSILGFFPLFLTWEQEHIVHLFSAVWSPSVKLFLWNIYISIKIFVQDKAFHVIIKQKKKVIDLKIQQEKYISMLFWHLMGKTKFMALGILGN